MAVIINSIFVNCWNINEEEANLFWASYVKQEYGVAIQSRFKRLKECFRKNSNIKIRFGKIKYIDYEIDKFNELKGYDYFLHKRKIYKYENELRAIILLMPHEKQKIPESDFTDNGIFIPVDLDVLIESIIISPNTESWYQEIIQSIIGERNLEKPVKKSTLDVSPNY